MTQFSFVMGSEGHWSYMIQTIRLNTCMMLTTVRLFSQSVKAFLHRVVSTVISLSDWYVVQ